MAGRRVAVPPAAPASRRSPRAPTRWPAGLRGAGVDHIVLALNSGDMTQIRALMENIAQQVIPQLR